MSALPAPVERTPEMMDNDLLRVIANLQYQLRLRDRFIFKIGVEAGYFKPDDKPSEGTEALLDAVDIAEWVREMWEEIVRLSPLP